MIRLYTDAAVKGNPGPAGLGILVLTAKEQIQLTTPLEGEWDNHQAEFLALKQGLSWLIENDYNEEMTFCYTDSQVVADTVNKAYTKNEDYKNYLENILHLKAQFNLITIEWVPESKNKGADNLARQALRLALKKE